MKRAAWVIAVLLSACKGNDTSSSPPDLAVVADMVVVADMAVVVDMATPPDMVVVADMTELNCAGIFNCILGCPPAQLNTCIPACIARGSATAQGYFNPLQSCAAPACYMPLQDGGAPPCAMPATVECSMCVTMNCGMQLADCRSH